MRLDDQNPITINERVEGKVTVRCSSNLLNIGSS